jgi:hypothetical protein
LSRVSYSLRTTTVSFAARSTGTISVSEGMAMAAEGRLGDDGHLCGEVMRCGIQKDITHQQGMVCMHGLTWPQNSLHGGPADVAYLHV